MQELFELRAGAGPLLVSMPHSGLHLPPGMSDRFSPEGRALIDTDWHIPRLYDFIAQMNVSVLQANYSRYVVDLNRDANGAPLYPGQRETGVCPTSTFMDQPIYRPGQSPEGAEIAERTSIYWLPYHAALKAELSRIHARHGFAILLDAHSIQSHLPRFFNGRLPDLNLGTADGHSCSAQLAESSFRVLHSSTFRAVHNGRFKGGYITRSSGRPTEGWHAIQLEISQRSYMSEYPDFIFDEVRAKRLQGVLADLLETLLEFAG